MMLTSTNDVAYFLDVSNVSVHRFIFQQPCDCQFLLCCVWMFASPAMKILLRSFSFYFTFLALWDEFFIFIFFRAKLLLLIGKFLVCKIKIEDFSLLTKFSCEKEFLRSNEFEKLLCTKKYFLRWERIFIHEIKFCYSKTILLKTFMNKKKLNLK